MKYREYIETHHVFTTDQLLALTELAASSVQTTLKRAVASGHIERIRRGAYVSKVGRFAGQGIDAFEVVGVLDSFSILSFHSALEAHGIAHNVSSVCQFRSVKVKSPFSYAGISYEPFPWEQGVSTQTIRGKAGMQTLATSREQTIIDCLNYPDRSGGVEEVLKSLSLFPYIDVEALVDLVANHSASLVARVGWFLEQKSKAWRIDLEALDRFEAMLGSGPAKLDKKSIRCKGWSKRWNLCLPESEEEVKSWIL